MEKLKQTLGSRKLWAALIAAALAVLTALLGEEMTPEIVGALRCAVTALVAYIFGEGAVDVARLIADALRKPDADCDTVSGAVASSWMQSAETMGNHGAEEAASGHASHGSDY